METSYYVEAVKNQVTGFGILESELNDNGYYESKNKGISNSYAIC